MSKSPSLEKVKNHKFGVFEILDCFSTTKNKYFVCKCQICGAVVNKTWYDLYRGPNKFCNGCRTSPTIRPKGEAALNRLLRVYKYAAIKRGLPLELSREEFRCITSSDCYYCGSPPGQTVKVYFRDKYKFNGQYYHNGIDRKNSKEGYNITNCVACCKYCNFGKNDQSYEEYLSRISKIYHRLIIEKEDFDYED